MYSNKNTKAFIRSRDYGIQIVGVVSETHTSNSSVTEHNVAYGNDVIDNVYCTPKKLTMNILIGQNTTNN